MRYSTPVKQQPCQAAPVHFGRPVDDYQTSMGYQQNPGHGDHNHRILDGNLAFVSPCFSPIEMFLLTHTFVKVTKHEPRFSEKR
jgi:hypothetical protein